jgi:hypothetical protein
MKSLTLASVLSLALAAGSASATVVRPALRSDCTNRYDPIRLCGRTSIGPGNTRWAQVDYQGQPAVFYANADCTGRSVRITSDGCKTFPFVARCVRLC